jgi:hypothetical protein
VLAPVAFRALHRLRVFPEKPVSGSRDCPEPAWRVTIRLFTLAIERNTKRLLAAAAGENAGERTPVECHILSWRELYDKSIITADRHHSSAGEWVLWGDSHFYTVKVITRPYYALPQQLCLSFDCFTENVTKTSSEGPSFTTTGPPIDEVASDFITFLSL